MAKGTTKFLRGGGKIVENAWNFFKKEYGKYYPDETKELAESIGKEWTPPKVGVTSARKEENQVAPHKGIKWAQEDFKVYQKEMQEAEKAGDDRARARAKRSMEDARGREKQEQRRYGQYAVEGLKVMDKKVQFDGTSQALRDHWSELYNVAPKGKGKLYQDFKEKYQKDGYEYYFTEEFKKDVGGKKATSGATYIDPPPFYKKDMELLRKYILSAHGNQLVGDKTTNPYHVKPGRGK
jgi:hypothetical protein